ncbi:MAG: LD-carboxypeptidase LdcB/DacB [Streptococcus sp.]|nr:LD-carboxypeptidase LdcB/DacB [Streptococcus sp.]
MMKRSLLSILLVASLTLTACSMAKKNKDTSVNNQNSSVKQNENQSSQTSASSEVPNRDKGVSYNGSYYSVKGKYDEIIIVNKHYPLSQDYNPGENPTAKAELLKLIAAMQEQGFAISDEYSGFRSYENQSQLYQNYVNQDGQEAADRYSARPGHSEHQSGLAFDLIDTSGNLVQEAGASQWLLENSYKYGFIVRYQKGMESSTGYMPESWHLRYIGKEAKDIAQSGQSLEEYYGFTGGEYDE